MIRNRGQKFTKIGDFFCRFICPYRGDGGHEYEDDKGYYIYCQKEHK